MSRRARRDFFRVLLVGVGWLSRGRGGTSRGGACRSAASSARASREPSARRRIDARTRARTTRARRRGSQTPRRRREARALDPSRDGCPWINRRRVCISRETIASSATRVVYRASRTTRRRATTRDRESAPTTARTRGRRVITHRVGLGRVERGRLLLDRLGADGFAHDASAGALRGGSANGSRRARVRGRDREGRGHGGHGRVINEFETRVGDSPSCAAMCARLRSVRARVRPASSPRAFPKGKSKISETRDAIGRALADAYFR